MRVPKFFVLLVLFSLAVVLAGCRSNSTKPSNPFAQNTLTVPPPATFSSQNSYLGQTPGIYIPQTPATTFPSSAVPSSTLPSSVPAPSAPSAITYPNAAETAEKATLFSAAAKESDWTPIAITTTSQTAFQAMETKAAANESGVPADSESLIVGTSHVVTEITDESVTLPEPPLLLYSGQYAE